MDSFAASTDLEKHRAKSVLWASVSPLFTAHEVAASAPWNCKLALADTQRTIGDVWTGDGQEGGGFLVRELVLCMLEFLARDNVRNELRIIVVRCLKFLCYARYQFIEKLAL